MPKIIEVIKENIAAFLSATDIPDKKYHIVNVREMIGNYAMIPTVRRYCRQIDTNSIQIVTVDVSKINQLTENIIEVVNNSSEILKDENDRIIEVMKNNVRLTNKFSPFRHHRPYPTSPEYHPIG